MHQKHKLLLAAVSCPGHTNFSPPLGLLYLAAYMRDRFPLEIVVIDQYLEEITAEQLLKKIVDFEPDIVGLSYATNGAHLVPDLTKSLRAALPDVFIAVGGPHITAAGEEALVGTSVDVGVRGEGELMFEKVLQAHFEGESMANIPGLIWRNSEDEVIVNVGSMPLIEDIDTLPLPAWDLLDIKRYWTRPSMVQVPGRKYFSLYSSRGCPYNCFYCHKTFGRTYRTHSPERVVEEIRYFKKQYQYDEIEFRDDCFNVNKQRMLDYSEILLKEVGPVRTAYFMGLRLDTLDDEVIEALTQAGMYFVGIPLESGVPRIQKLMGKEIQIPRFMSIMESFVKRHIFTNGHMMFGFPSETLEEMEESFCVAKDSLLHVAAFFVVTPFPNTQLYQYVKETMPEKLSHVSYDTTDLFDTSNNISGVPTKDFAAFYRKLPARFYLKPGRLARIFRDYPKRAHLLINGYSFAKGALSKTKERKTKK